MQSPASLFIVAILLGPVEGKPNASNEVDLTYPLTRRVEQVDSFHGVEVPDPYRWLEDQEAAETRDWIEVQNEYTDGIFEQIPGRGRLTSLATSLLKVDAMGTPRRRGDRSRLRRGFGRGGID